MEKAIRFLAPVNTVTTDQLFKAVDCLLKSGCRKLRLLISSPGGSVFHGLSIYNYLKGLPIEVHTYNFGSVDSIGVVIYCAGTKRFAVPHSRFLIHGVQFNTGAPISADEKQLEEYLKSLNIDQRNIAKVIADTTLKPIEDIEKDMNNRIALNPEEAKNYHLVDEISSSLLEENIEVLTIGEPIPSQPYGIGQTIIQPQQVTQNSSTPILESFSDSNVRSFGTFY